MFCENCGYKLRDDGCFCENCGKRFSKGDFDEDEIEIYEKKSYNYFGHKIKEFPKILFIAYTIEFVAILIACIFPVYIAYLGIGNSLEIKNRFSIKFFVIAILLLILSITTGKKTVFHIISIILYFLHPFFNFVYGKLESYFTIFYYISTTLMIISLLLAIIYKSKANNKEN